MVRVETTALKTADLCVKEIYFYLLKYWTQNLYYRITDDSTEFLRNDLY